MATEPVLPHQYVKTLKDTLESAYTKARKHMQATAMRSEELYNRRVHGQEYEVGDLVWLNNPVVPRTQNGHVMPPPVMAGILVGEVSVMRVPLCKRR